MRTLCGDGVVISTHREKGGQVAVSMEAGNYVIPLVRHDSRKQAKVAHEFFVGEHMGRVGILGRLYRLARA